MASNSQVHLRGTRPSALRAPVAVNTNRSADGFSTLTLFTSTRRESNATANRRGCGRSPRTSTRCTRSERVAEAMFRQKSSARTSRERSSAMAGRHIRHSPATSSGAGHIFLREAEDVADKYEDGEPIHRHLTQMYVGLQSWLETDPSLRERAQMHRSSQNGLKSLVRCSATDDPVATLLGKIKGGSTTGSPSSVSQQSRQRTTLRRMRFVSRLFSGKSSGRSATTAGCSFTRRCCPCWRHRASRDAIRGRPQASALSETTR